MDFLRIWVTSYSDDITPAQTNILLEFLKKETSAANEFKLLFLRGQKKMKKEISRSKCHILLVINIK